MRAAHLLTIAGLLAWATLSNETPIGNARHADDSTYPAADWAKRAPAEAGLLVAKLEALAKLAGGHGCVVRHGYLVFTWGDPTHSKDIASAFKPILSALLLLAVQQGKIKSVDAPVADFKPALRELAHGAAMTWRQLASQTSGYGLAELPGKAYAYNDYALALYYDTLTLHVFGREGTRVLKEHLGDVLGFQDGYTFNAFGPKERPGRLAISVRDLARVGLLFLRNGNWKEKQIIRPDMVRMALDSPIPADLPRSSGKESAMLAGQRTLGGGKNQTAAGPGYYSFNWWLNRTDKDGRRLYVDAPPDTFTAMGHGGERALWVMPSLDLIVTWNDAKINDHDASPGNPNTKCNQAARLMREAVEP